MDQRNITLPVVSEFREDAIFCEDLMSKLESMTLQNGANWKFETPRKSAARVLSQNRREADWRIDASENLQRKNLIERFFSILTQQQQYSAQDFFVVDVCFGDADQRIPSTGRILLRLSQSSQRFSSFRSSGSFFGVSPARRVAVCFCFAFGVRQFATALLISVLS